MSKRKLEITEEDVEAWCKANRVQLCRTWDKCSCLWIEPHLFKVDAELFNDGNMHDHIMACVTCAPECKHCGYAYAEDPFAVESKKECDDSSCERNRGIDDDDDK